MNGSEFKIKDISDLTCVDGEYIEYDERGNLWEDKIYLIDDNYYRVSFCNIHPAKDKDGFIKFIRVYKKTKVIKEDYWDEYE